MKSIVNHFKAPSGSHAMTDKVTINLILEKGVKPKEDLDASMLYSNDIMTGKSNISIPIALVEVKTENEISTIELTFSMETFDISNDLFLKRSLENFGRFVFKFHLEDGFQVAYSIVVMIHKEEEKVVYTFVTI
jgi:hypothetical protein